ncbi:hypothetical protein [Spirochaeta cellobiosiphila]|uniref:hypothetical protein n=1 Tax=Spirochaeta cellobiosiphila TaxID=504483 RepID=UPI0004094E82|nr:hypothetical protein [Spirochaeta cellobiosiphila]
MNKRKFFQTVTRINSILFLGVLSVFLILLFILLIDILPFNQRRIDNTIQVNTTEEKNDNNTKYNLGYIKNIYGSDTYIIELKTIDTTSKLSYSGEPSMIKNLLFIEGNQMNTRWLFESNNQIIKSYNQWRIQSDINSKPGDTYQLVFDLIKYDSDNDGKITLLDNVTRVITDPSGKNLIELGTYERILKSDIDVANKQYLLLAYKDGQFIFQRFDLDDFSLINEIILDELSIPNLEI